MKRPLIILGQGDYARSHDDLYLEFLRHWRWGWVLVMFLFAIIGVTLAPCATVRILIVSMYMIATGLIWKRNAASDAS